jgi:hypothetical protein
LLWIGWYGLLAEEPADTQLNENRVLDPSCFLGNLRKM